jgi:hypothetical protein
LYKNQSNAKNRSIEVPEVMNLRIPWFPKAIDLQVDGIELDVFECGW